MVKWHVLTIISQDCSQGSLHARRADTMDKECPLFPRVSLSQSSDWHWIRRWSSLVREDEALQPELRKCKTLGRQRAMNFPSLASFISSLLRTSHSGIMILLCLAVQGVSLGGGLVSHRESSTIRAICPCCGCVVSILPASGAVFEVAQPWGKQTSKLLLIQAQIHIINGSVRCFVQLRLLWIRNILSNLVSGWF